MKGQQHLIPPAPRAPRTMKKPRKAVLYQQLDDLQAEVERQRAIIETLSMPWWRRLNRRNYA